MKRRRGTPRVRRSSSKCAAAWTPGDTGPHEIANFGNWTFNTLVERAKKLLPTKPEKEVYQQLLHEIYPTPSGRVPRIVTTTAGKAIWQAQHQA